jgi:tRNA nucleotidyltransferase (CCA-adding enzyme)
MANSNKKTRIAFSKGALVKLNKLLHRVLIDVRPTPSEIATVTAASNDIMGRLKRVAPKNVEIMLLGSISRGTQIKGTSDIDIFLLFPKSADERKMEEAGLRIAKKIVKRGESYEIKYAEHPYLKLNLSGINATADIVPAFKISSADEMGSAVDRTQLHNEFVNKNLSQKQRNDVRILKSFLDHHGIYGAEARITGFSGYLCELLVHHYGSFSGVIEAFANIRMPLAIDPVNRKTLDDAAAFVKRFGKDFVVIDPTDRNRNVAANVSDMSLGKAVFYSRRLIKNPDIDMFYGKGYQNTNAGARLRSLQDKLFVSIDAIAFKLPDISEDILWQQLAKLRGNLAIEMKRHGFELITSFQCVSGNAAVIAFMSDSNTLGHSVVKGPNALMGDASESFIKKHKNSLLMLFDDERIISIEKPEFKRVHEFIKAYVNGRNKNFPSYLANSRTAVYSRDIPEEYAKLLYEAIQSETVPA